MNEETKKFYDKFQNIISNIENELKENNQLPIDVMLLNMNPSDVLNVMSNYAPISFEILKQNNDIQNYFVSYLYKKKEYFNNLSISNEKLGILLSKDGAGQVQHDKSESFYYNESELDKIENYFKSKDKINITINDNIENSDIIAYYINDDIKTVHLYLILNSDNTYLINDNVKINDLNISGEIGNLLK